MGNLRSFEKLDYSIRPNKNVERKLIVELLKRMGSAGQFNFGDYRYVGLGSIWFSDFSLIHRALRIVDMISIEREVTRKRRLSFNKPFDCVRLILDEYSNAFPNLTWEKRSVVWLDFDDALKPEIFEDLKRTLLHVPSGSVVFVSVNADSWQLDNVESEGEKLLPSQALRFVTSRADLPADFEGKLGRAKFPTLVGEILANSFRNAISDGRLGLTFVPLMNMTYSDNVPFVTYGGIVLDVADLAIFRTIDMADLAYLAGPPQYDLSVPHLTAKEKMRFDQLLPRVGVPTADQLGFELRDKEIEAYIRFYLQYPVFGEHYF